MAGNKRVYQQAIKKASNYAWDQKWSKAVNEYQRALKEFPDDVVALTGLGRAYQELKQLDQALEAYQQAAARAPDNPEIHLRVADVLERLARLDEAAEAYAQVAEAALRRRDVDTAIEAWKQALRLKPDHTEIRHKLAKAYEGRDEYARAAVEYLILARALAMRKQREKAIEACQKALQLEPRNAEGMAILEALRAGAPLPDGPTARYLPDESGKRTLESYVLVDEEPIFTGRPGEGGGSPADIARERALTALAEAIFEAGEEEVDLSTMQADLLLGQAVDLQTRGEVEQAIKAYEQAIQMGADNAAAHFNLGLLLKESMHFHDAIEHLNRALADPTYRLGALFALGECYQGLGKVDEALEHFLEVVKIVDLQTVRHEQADDLIQLYERLADSYLAKGDPEQALAFTNALVSFLSERGWEDKVVEARRRLDSLTGEGTLMSLAELVAMPGADEILSSLSMMQEYLRRGRFHAAIEECYWAIQHSPYYLPLHVRLADILVEEGRVEEAAAKLMAVAEVYRVRGEIQQAIEIFYRILRIAPMEIGVRTRLIEMLVARGQIDQALEQYLSLADAYFQLAQVERAWETYQEALRYAPRGSAERKWESRILHRMGDLSMQRLDWRQAVKTYQRIKQVDPEDEKARLYLVDLYYKLGQSKNALEELDEMVSLYLSRGEQQKAIAAIRNTISMYPENIPLRLRLSKVLLELGHREEAIAELDAVGEMQLEAGRFEEAERTVQAILNLQPPKADLYRRLLQQIRARRQQV